MSLIQQSNEQTNSRCFLLCILFSFIKKAPNSKLKGQDNTLLGVCDSKKEYLLLHFASQRRYNQPLLCLHFSIHQTYTFTIYINFTREVWISRCRFFFRLIQKKFYLLLRILLKYPHLVSFLPESKKHIFTHHQL